MSAPYLSAGDKRPSAQQVAGALYYHAEVKPQQQQQKKQKQQHSKPQGQARQVQLGQQGQQQQSRRSKSKQDKKQVQQQQQSLQHQPLWLQQQEQPATPATAATDPAAPSRATWGLGSKCQPASAPVPCTGTQEDAAAADQALEAFVQLNLQQPMHKNKKGDCCSNVGLFCLAHVVTSSPFQAPAFILNAQSKSNCTAII